jgi:branched-chain amino acid transport system ATP-binding protein
LSGLALLPRRKMLTPLRGANSVSHRVEELLERFSLVSKADEVVSNLSHGEQRRLEIAICLAVRPSVLLLDEPTQGMSHGDTHEMALMIKELSETVAILLVEHDVDLVMKISDRIIVMHQGRKIADDLPEAVRGNRAVQDAFFGTETHA